jgi:hypothetical protein
MQILKCPEENQRFFAALRMTICYDIAEGEGVESGGATFNPLTLLSK